MRELHSHETGVVNELIRVIAEDEPGLSGANCLYSVSWAQLARVANPGKATIPFQKGALQEAGANGLTNEVLLAILIDRLEGFQRGPFACAQTEVALFSAKTALFALHLQTKDRIARGLEVIHRH